MPLRGRNAARPCYRDTRQKGQMRAKHYQITATAQAGGSSLLGTPALHSVHCPVRALLPLCDSVRQVHRSMEARMSNRRMNYFLLLTAEQQQQSIRRLARSGMADSSIAAATGLHVDDVRRALAQSAEVPQQAAS